MEPEGQTCSQIPQPMQLSVTRSRCCQASGGIWLIRSKNCRCAARSVSVTGEIVAMLYDETRFKGGFLARLMR